MVEPPEFVGGHRVGGLGGDGGRGPRDDAGRRVQAQARRQRRRDRVGHHRSAGAARRVARDRDALRVDRRVRRVREAARRDVVHRDDEADGGGAPGVGRRHRVGGLGGDRGRGARDDAGRRCSGSGPPAGRATPSRTPRRPPSCSACCSRWRRPSCRPPGSSRRPRLLGATSFTVMTTADGGGASGVGRGHRVGGLGGDGGGGARDDSGRRVQGQARRQRWRRPSRTRPLRRCCSACCS